MRDYVPYSGARQYKIIIIEGVMRSCHRPAGKIASRYFYRLRIMHERMSNVRKLVAVVADHRARFGVYQSITDPSVSRS